MIRHIADDQLIDYLNQGLSATRMRLIDTHLMTCAECQTRFDSYQTTQNQIYSGISHTLQRTQPSSQMSFAALFLSQGSFNQSHKLHRQPFRLLYSGGIAAVFGLFIVGLVTLFQTASQIPSSSMTMPQSMFRANPQHTGVYETEGIVTLKGVLWQFGTRMTLHERASPVIANDLVYFGSHDGHLYALDHLTGQQRWAFNLSDDKKGLIFPLTPAVAYGLVFYGHIGRHLHVLDAETSELYWQSETAITSPPTVADGVVYFSDTENRVHALNSRTGFALWQTKLSQNVIWSAPAIAGNLVYVGGRDGYLYALDKLSGREAWRFKTGGWIAASPAVANGVVYIGSKDGFLYALEAKTGHLRWQFQTQRSIWSSPAILDNTVYVGSDALYALNAETGAEKWRFASHERLLSSPSLVRGSLVSDGHIFVDGLVYFGSRDKHLYALNSRTGKVVWRFAADGPILSSPAIADGKLYFSSIRGTLYALH